MSVESLIHQIQKDNPEAETDFDFLKNCYSFAEEAHKSQYRKSGEPYFMHCVRTAEILVQLRLDIDTICAGLMHDVLEDTGITRGEMEERFGANIAGLVEGVTKIGRYKFGGGQRKRQAETYRKLLLATAEDMRVILIKLADRLHNMETLEHLSQEQQQRISKETLEIYAPIAHRLGIWSMMSRLEDLSLKYLLPDRYREIADLLDEKLEERQAYCKKMEAIIHSELKKHGIPSNVRGRTKHIYSIYQKIHEKGTPFKDICDLVGLRIIVEDDWSCYSALGVLHLRWNYLPDRVRDWIGQPKKNGYQSLHTTILDNGKPIEIQIRSREMHQIAENGIAAHWSYKEGLPTTKEAQSIFANYKEMLDDIKDTQDVPDTFTESMKLELFQDEVYVFTPKGDIHALPVGSTAIDFAYRIHTDIGNTCCGAEVNNVLTPIREPLKNGDRINILTSPNSMPSRAWLRIVKTTNARTKIRHWFKEKDRIDAIELGKRLLKAEFQVSYLNATEFMKQEKLIEVARQLGLETVDELFIRIGNGSESATQVVNLLKPEKVIQEKTEEVAHRTEPTIQLDNGIDLGMVRVMKCCNPIPGDDIVGYLTRGRGVSVHRADCLRLLDEPERFVSVNWQPEEGTNFPAQIYIECHDKPGMLGEITTAIAKFHVNIREGNFKPSTKTTIDDTATDYFTLDVSGVDQLREVMDAVKSLKGVERVDRKI
ncbi:bifunctional (p)ppGpp synthetase/guanosine-3',5'-bis(diphosphate) 3'-pyrophosphohydrolase [Candidatus Poribacteria bacterium]|nr:bifunctional (p)ppGpp synthetase/guanosine-3',5'-bis(diphosphate) 3'-pyrophosphohydrolase [Candidatus Poribacteria bacterium]MYB65789.1 bifunctional (p)ppGpp synthetase/guanosine-3',5'-bis(diphosphate) 3'-pyrophosphohydrolase [Candidatus Poribacteria bacterium]